MSHSPYVLPILIRVCSSTLYYLTFDGNVVGSMSGVCGRRMDGFCEVSGSFGDFREVSETAG